VDLSEAEQEVAAAVRDADRVDPVGGATHREVGGAAPLDATPVHAPGGIVTYDPADLTVCLGAGTTVAALAAELSAAGQECALDPRDDRATVGGVLATGLSGPRRLRTGPLRDQVLEVRFATADGRLVRAGGATVKNVSGYDLPRLLVGSLGTLGVVTRVILRCRPIPRCAAWAATPREPDDVRADLLRPSSLLWDGRFTHVLLEGDEADVVSQARGARLEPADAPAMPEGRHRGRISVAPDAIARVGRALGDGVGWIGEGGIGTVHVATDDPDALAHARSVATDAGGWMLREAGAPELDGFGVELPNAGIMARVRAAFDPGHKLAPGRLPLASPRATSAIA
jgi:glycolate oxidase FAD binding subunit